MKRPPDIEKVYPATFIVNVRSQKHRQANIMRARPTYILELSKNIGVRSIMRHVARAYSSFVNAEF